MSSISKATDVLAFPARTAIGIAGAGVRTTVRLLGWAAEQAFGQAPVRSTPTVTVPEPRPAQPDVDPMAASQVPRDVEPQPVPAKKSPAKQAAKGAAAKKAAAAKTAKKAPAKKAPAKKAPSKQAAVLAPALGLSEDEVAEVIGTDVDKA